jgi:hypothetical protein
VGTVARNNAPKASGWNFSPVAVEGQAHVGQVSWLARVGWLNINEEVVRMEDLDMWLPSDSEQFLALTVLHY